VPGTAPVAAALAATARSNSPTIVSAPTRLVLNGDIASRHPLSAPPRHFRAPGGGPVQPTEFAVAIAPDGQTLHALQQSGSGDAALDRTAQQFLVRCRFDPAPGNSPAWGTAIFLWGDDMERGEKP